MLEADIRLHLDRLRLEADFSAGPGEVVALLGPNGAGKSTVLRALAGLLRLAGGRIELDGKVLDQPGERVFVPPEQRAVALMFQDYLLFPHLSATENVAFGLRARGTDRRAARASALAELERLGVGSVAAARPGAMSGGQQQRVALARALITRPRLLLLDEPLAALDVSTKAEVRRLLRGALRDTRAAHVLVTHDLLDAVALADRMLVLQDGAIVQSGTPAEVTARPRSRYVADLTGVTLLRGTAAGPRLRLTGGGELVTTAGWTGPALAAVPPAAVTVGRERPAAARVNVWCGEVGAVDLLGDRVRVRVDGTPAVTAEVTPSAVEKLRLDDGGPLWASVDPAAITVYPP
jgi:molybdate transport system ATP-binding protein